MSNKLVMRGPDTWIAPGDLTPGTQIVALFGEKKVVAVVGYGPGDWAAYQGPGDWTDDRVADRGDKLAEEIALRLFPMFRGKNGRGRRFYYRL